jgi:DNA-binding response OmpR family regulator
MDDGSLRGRRILVLEDEYMLSEDMREALEAEGAIVLGPAPRVRDGLTILDEQAAIDAAVLDVNLQGEMVFPLADRLIQSGTPFLFATGYDPDVIPARFQSVPRCEKPVRVDAIREAIDAVIDHAGH